MHAVSLRHAERDTADGHAGATSAADEQRARLLRAPRCPSVASVPSAWTCSVGVRPNLLTAEQRNALTQVLRVPLSAAFAVMLLVPSEAQPGFDAASRSAIRANTRDTALTVPKSQNHAAHAVPRLLCRSKRAPHTAYDWQPAPTRPNMKNGTTVRNNAFASASAVSRAVCQCHSPLPHNPVARALEVRHHRSATLRQARCDRLGAA